MCLGERHPPSHTHKPDGHDRPGGSCSTTLPPLPHSLNMLVLALVRLTPCELQTAVSTLHPQAIHPPHSRPAPPFNPTPHTSCTRSLRLPRQHALQLLLQLTQPTRQAALQASAAAVAGHDLPSGVALLCSRALRLHCAHCSLQADLLPWLDARFAHLQGQGVRALISTGRRQGR